MLEQLSRLGEAADEEIAGVWDVKQLEEVRVRYLGKKGLVTGVLRGLGSLDPSLRPAVGDAANRLKLQLEEKLAARGRELQGRLRRRAAALDVTLPGWRLPRGGYHPLRRVQEEIEEIFLGMGFTVAEGPEVESEYYNFEALNIPADHPARDMQDSFYLGDGWMLRTQTSPVQIRTMEATCPRVPVKIIAPGRVYRRDQADATHSPIFHQVEGLLVDEGVSLADLKGVLGAFAREMFGEGTRIRLRPSFFPFTEPSAEVDVTCTICVGKGCRTCKGTGWLEILGAGMVHPKVLAAGGYDPERVSGFAFGMGVERIAMLKLGVDDLRVFFQNDLRFLEQF